MEAPEREFRGGEPEGGVVLWGVVLVDNTERPV